MSEALEVQQGDQTAKQLVKENEITVETEDSSADSAGSQDDESDVESSNSTSNSGSGSNSSQSTGSESEGEVRSKSSDDSFRTVNNTMIKSDTEQSTSVSNGAAILESTETRSKSCSPVKRVVKSDQNKTLGSPKIKTPGKSMTPPAVNKGKPTPKKTPKKTPAKSTPVKSEGIQTPAKARSKSTPNKQVTPSPAEVKQPSEGKPVIVPEAKKETTPTPTKKRSRTGDKGKEKEKPVKEAATKTERKSRALKRDGGTSRESTKDESKEKKRKTERKEEIVQPKKSATKKAKHASTSTEEEAEVQSTSTRIQKVPNERRFQKIAISRAKLCGLIENGQIRILQITEALKIINQAKFSISPTHVFRRYYKCPGVGLPHIRRHLRAWQIKYGGLIANMAKLQLNMALAAEKKKLAMLGSGEHNEFRNLRLFENDVKETEAAKPQSMEVPTATIESPPSKRIKLEQGASKQAGKGTDKEDSTNTEDGTSSKSVKRKKSKKDKKSAKAKKSKGIITEYQELSRIV